MNSFVSCQQTYFPYSGQAVGHNLQATTKPVPKLIHRWLSGVKQFTECWIHLKILICIMLCRTYYAIWCTLRCWLCKHSIPEQTSSGDFIILQIARKSRRTHADGATDRHLFGMTASKGKQLGVL